jgi:CBS domain-containing protein
MGKKVSDAMTANPTTLSRDDRITTAARLMEEHDIGSVPVVDQDYPVGIITDRDIVVRIVAQGKDPSRLTVGEIATENPHYVRPDDDLDEALALMASAKVRRLLVTDDDRLVGILAQADAVHEVKDKQAGQLVEEISRPD